MVDTSFQREDPTRVTNTLTIPNLNREHLNTILTCQASNSNSSLPVSTSVTFSPSRLLLDPSWNCRSVFWLMELLFQLHAMI